MLSVSFCAHLNVLGRRFSMGVILQLFQNRKHDSALRYNSIQMSQFRYIKNSNLM